MSNLRADVIGEQRKVVRDGDLTGRVDLTALAKRPHLYAAGPLEGLRACVKSEPYPLFWA